MTRRSASIATASVLLGIGLALIMLHRPEARTAEANNFKAAGAHIQSIHSILGKEKWCTDVHSSTYSLANALTVINAAYTGGGSGDWHGVYNGAIDLSDALFGQCFDTPGWQSAYRLIDQVVTNSQAYCVTATSCQYMLYGYGCNPSCHYQSSHQILRQSNMEVYPLQIHTVNHETGHAFGFDDPHGTGCPAGGSVMHSVYYGCSTDYSFPTQLDRDTLTVVIVQSNY